MKKVLLSLLVLTALGLIIAACVNPSSAGVDEAVAPRAVTLIDTDKAAAAAIIPVVSGRTNASGKDISSNAQGAAVPGMYFFWDPKQKDNGYLKVDFFMFDKYESFVLTTKEANKYWDFLIQPVKGQEVTEDGFFVFFIPKQEKNINGVWISDYVDKVLFGPPVEQSFYDFTEAVGVDFPNPDRGFYRANDGNVVPVTGGGNPGTTGANVTQTANIGSGGTATPTYTRIMQCYFDMRNFSNNMVPGGKLFNATWIQNNARGQTRAQILAAFREWYALQPKNETQPLTEAALTYIRRGFQAVRDGNAVFIPRFNYDGGGWSYHDGRLNNGVSNVTFDDLLFDCEPDKDTMLMHIAQLKDIFYEYEDIIMHVDGGFFGPWGEMHSSTFGTSTEAYAWLMEALLDAVPPSRTISAHLGAFLSWYNWKYDTDYDFSNVDTMPAPVRGTPEARFGFFNDSYAFGSDDPSDPEEPANDWGSLAEGEDYVGGEFDRGKVINWIRKQGNNYGGEAQDEGTRTPWNRFPFVGWEASVAHTSYLNRDYDSAVHNGWNGFTYNEAAVLAPFTNGYSVEGGPVVTHANFDPAYAGRKGGEFIRDRLGYRLVLREAALSEWTLPRIGILNFEGKIQNVGFGNVVNFKNVYVILKNADGAYTALTDLDARDWLCDLDNSPANTDAWRDLSFSVNMSEFGTVPPGEYGVYLKIQDPLERSVNKRAIQFANNGAGIWDAALGANLIGYTTVAD